MPRRIWVVALCLASACSGEEVHVFGAQRYDPTHNCLEPGQVVDVVDGPDPGTCSDVRCWISPAGEVYITATACDAPLGYVDRTLDAPRSVCSNALVAYALGDKGACH